MDIIFWIRDYLVERAEDIVTLSLSAAELAGNTPALFWFLRILILILLVVLFYVVPGGGIFTGSFLYLRSSKFDRINRWIMIGSGIFLVAFSSVLNDPPQINPILLWILVQIIVPVGRFLIFPLLCTIRKKLDEQDYYETRNLKIKIVSALIAIAVIITILWTYASLGLKAL